MIQPSPMVELIKSASRGFAFNSQRRWVMPLVLLLNRSGQSWKKSGTSDVLINSVWISRDAVDRMASDHRQIRHAHLLGRRLLDQRHPPDALGIPRMGNRNPIQKAAIDLIDDLQVPRKHDSSSGTGHFSSASGASV